MDIILTILAFFILAIPAFYSTREKFRKQENKIEESPLPKQEKVEPSSLEKRLENRGYAYVLHNNIPYILIATLLYFPIQDILILATAISASSSEAIAKKRHIFWPCYHWRKLPQLSQCF